MFFFRVGRDVSSEITCVCVFLLMISFEYFTHERGHFNPSIMSGREELTSFHVFVLKENVDEQIRQNLLPYVSDSSK